MLRYLYSKKGFTMVELIVVIALIGILAGLFFPMMAGGGNPQDADSKAESFYRAMQNIMIDYKADSSLASADKPFMEEGFYKLPEAAPDDDPDNDVYAKEGEYLLIYCTATLQDDFTDARVALVDSASTPATSYSAGLSGVSDPTLVEKLNALSSGEDNGYYYALVDSQCRVLECYWCKNDFQDVFDTYNAKYNSPQIKFTDMSYIDSYCVGAFPNSYSTKDADLFLLAD